MISADVKLKPKKKNNKKQGKIWWLYLKKLSPSKLEIQCRKDMYFSFDLG